MSLRFTAPAVTHRGSQAGPSRGRARPTEEGTAVDVEGLQAIDKAREEGNEQQPVGEAGTPWNRQEDEQSQKACPVHQ